MSLWCHGWFVGSWVKAKRGLHRQKCELWPVLTAVTFVPLNLTGACFFSWHVGSTYHPCILWSQIQYILLLSLGTTLLSSRWVNMLSQSVSLSHYFAVRGSGVEQDWLWKVEHTYLTHNTTWTGGHCGYIFTFQLLISLGLQACGEIKSVWGGDITVCRVFCSTHWQRVQS